ncbi:MAG: redoxin domain-containing protein [Candidatus Marinimicrobia bacterium]|nr:redoxin domain-containing protein [Candidatus Neomarinimicrobiota bacterium]
MTYRFLILLSVFMIGIFFFPSASITATELTENNLILNTNLDSTKHPAPDFKLLDTEGKTVQLSDFKNQVIVLTFIKNVDNRKTGTYWMNENRKWLESLQNSYKNNIVIFGIKELRGLSKMIPKSLIKSVLSKESFRFLLDWDGNVFDTYDISSIFTLIIINSDGIISYSLSEKFTDKKSIELSNKIDILLD